MLSIKDQITAQKKAKTENLKDIYYVDYCYHCKDPEVRTGEKIQCKHEWYCHHDGGEVQDIEAKIGVIRQDIWLRGYACAYERETLKKLYDTKWELIKKCRREMPRIKVKT